MIDDAVLQEVRKAKERFARSHGFDLGAMAAYLRAKQEAGDRRIVRLEPPGAETSFQRRDDPQAALQGLSRTAPGSRPGSADDPAG